MIDGAKLFVTKVTVENLAENYRHRTCPLALQPQHRQDTIPHEWHFLWIRATANVEIDGHPVYVTTSGSRWVPSYDEYEVKKAQATALEDIEALLVRIGVDNADAARAVAGHRLDNPNLIYHG